jgi:transposase-like protein
LRRHFDRLQLPAPTIRVAEEAVALTFDGTFFGRGYGLMIYRACGRNIYWQEIESETLAVMEQGLRHLSAQGWRFSSVTIDGRQGTVSLIKRLFPCVPIQLCIFHQKAIVRRYLTAKPKTYCGKEIRTLISFLLLIDEPLFLACLEGIKETYKDFLKERNEQGQFKHRKLRSALRSLTTNAAYLYTWQRHPELKIPTTTNSCDGSFAHWKNKVKIHRGLRQHRRAKMIQNLLAKT